MRSCKCGKPAEWFQRNRRFTCRACAIDQGLLIPCTGEAHSNPYIDHCSVCMPRWEWVEVVPAPPVVHQELELAKFSDENNKLIQKYLNAPSEPAWDDLHCMGIPHTGMTIWQTVLCVDPSFPRTGRQYRGDKLIRHWKEIPSSQMIKEALVYATH